MEKRQLLIEKAEKEIIEKIKKLEAKNDEMIKVDFRIEYLSLV